MSFQYDFDTSPYFATVAATLLRRHGEDALALADQAIRRLKMTGDAEGIFLWEGVRSAMFDTLLDALSDRSQIPAERPATDRVFCH